MTPDYSDVSLTRFQATVAFRGCCPYVVGDTYARSDTPTFEFKASATGYSGGGYPRVRSRERREHTPGDGTDDVFVSIHRLAAVAWCYPAEWSIGEILDDLGDKDVHHTFEMPAANLAEGLSVVDHARHAELTQAQRRAYAADRKRQVEREQAELNSGTTCTRCDAEGDATVDGTNYCLDCATDVAAGTDLAIQL